MLNKQDVNTNIDQVPVALSSNIIITIQNETLLLYEPANIFCPVFILKNQNYHPLLFTRALLYLMTTKSQQKRK